jgi:hypothetical protein
MFDKAFFYSKMLYSSKTFIYKTGRKTMYTATAIYQNSEIGYGEGEGDAYAVEDCIDSIPTIFKECAARNDIQIIVRNSSGLVYVNTWLQYEIATN